MRKLLTALVLMGVFFLSPVFASEGGGSQTKHFTITMDPSKNVYAPGDTMEIKVYVTDKNTGEPVGDAKVTGSINIYKGNNTAIEAKSEGNGVYLITDKVNTSAKWGGITLTLTVTKDNKSDTVNREISFMIYNVWEYGIFVTLSAIILGIGVGAVFGGVKH